MSRYKNVDKNQRLVGKLSQGDRRGMQCSSEPEEHGNTSNRFHPGGETTAVALRTKQGPGREVWIFGMCNKCTKLFRAWFVQVDLWPRIYDVHLTHQTSKLEVRISPTTKQKKQTIDTDVDCFALFQEINLQEIEWRTLELVCSRCWLQTGWLSAVLQVALIT